MTAVTNDSSGVRPRLGSGLIFALSSSAAFGLSGPLAKGLVEAGWTAGSAVTARLLIAAAVMLLPAVISLRGRRGLVRKNLGLIVAYGAFAVTGCQLAYFNAVNYMEVGVALLIEFTAPVAVIGWLWFRHGQRPGRLTMVGAVIAAVGLVLVLNLVAGAHVEPIGVLWALGAMTGAAVYWLISADEGNGLPPMVLAAGGLTFGGILLLIAGLIGIIPFAAPRTDVAFVGATVPWWVPIVALGIVTAAVAYVLGIEASRRLGSRLASFVGLAEVLSALTFAWLLLDEAPAPVQLAGGVLILVGVIVVRLGEPQVAHRDCAVEPA
ncbi:EamA family transporter [Mycobacterium sp. URHB0021]|jgi:drug/metabolite transporter (DMT)-like permease